MKDSYPHLSLGRVCRSFGVTRQAYYQHFWTAQTHCMEHELVLIRVMEIRKDHRRLGGRKLLGKLEAFLMEHRIAMGRDALFDLLSDHGLLVRPLRKYTQTTRSSHWLRKWPNLVKHMELTGPGQLWVSDITYFWTAEEGYTYISLITDAWSHRIMGCYLATDLAAASTLKALHMAIQQVGTVPQGLIHHSDRGVQYCSQAYVDVLQANKIAISMTEKGDPLENAVAERINGIIKQEYLDTWAIKTVAQARSGLQRAVLLYNTDRPHNSISDLTPDQAHTGTMKVKRLWKNYYPKRTSDNPIQDVLSTVNLSSDLNPNL